MPTSTIIRATFFVLGAAVGGGAVAVLNASKKRETPSTPTVPTTSSGTTRATGSKAPIEVGVTGDIRFSAGAATAAGPVLKYGNPGTQRHKIIFRVSFKPTVVGYALPRVQAPFPTNSYAERMWPRMIVECGIPRGSVAGSVGPPTAFDVLRPQNI